MNNSGDNRHEEFVERVGSALNAQAEALDGATRSRLNRARQAAVVMHADNNIPKGTRWNWMPAGGMALASVLVMMIWFDGNQPGGPATENGAAAPTLVNPGITVAPSAGDLEVLMVDEELEMLHDLDFYNWLQSVPVRSGAGSVGQSSRSEGLG